MEVVLYNVACLGSLKTKLTISECSKTLQCWCAQICRISPQKVYLIKKGFKKIKLYSAEQKSRRKRRCNSWVRRRLHTDDEVIMIQ